MPAQSTYTAIRTFTLGSATTTISFENIPQTYTDLILVFQARNTVSLNNARIYFNSDTAANYSGTYLQSTGSPSSGRVVNTNYAYTPELTTADWGIVTANIMNYTNPVAFKTLIVNGGTGTDRVSQFIDTWRSTAPITRVDVQTFGGNFTADSRFTLYGIGAA